MGVIVNPVLSPYILEHWPAIFLNYGTVLTQKYAYIIEQIVIDVSHNGRSAIVGI